MRVSVLATIMTSMLGALLIEIQINICRSKFLQRSRTTQKEDKEIKGNVENSYNERIYNGIKTEREKWKKKKKHFVSVVVNNQSHGPSRSFGRSTTTTAILSMNNRWRKKKYLFLLWLCVCVCGGIMSMSKWLGNSRYYYYSWGGLVTWCYSIYIW